MNTKPILFSAPMVRAVLAGRKTQTRRVVKPKHLQWLENRVQNFLDGKWDERPLPYGKPGDRLWVRETVIITPPNWCERYLSSHPEAPGGPRLVQYLASSPCREAADDYRLKATPSIHMPRWASRITLEVTGVRVEHLNDITESDCIAEGCYKSERFPLSNLWTADDNSFTSQGAVETYRNLWEKINGSGSWVKNPLVWVIEFNRVDEGGAA